MPRQPPGPRPRRQRARYGPPSVEKLLGALPVVADLCQRLDLRGIIDRACPVREVATLTHGQVIQALAHLRLLPASGHDPPIIPQPPPLQARLLELLDVDPTQPP